MLPRHEPRGVSVNKVNLPNSPTWPDSNSKLYLLYEEEQVKFLSTFQLLVSVGFPPYDAYQELAKDLRGLYTQF